MLAQLRDEIPTVLEAEFAELAAPFWCVAFSSNSQRAVAAGEGTLLYLMDVETGKLVRELDTNRSEQPPK